MQAHERFLCRFVFRRRRRKMKSLSLGGWNMLRANIFTTLPVFGTLLRFECSPWNFFRQLFPVSIIKVVKNVLCWVQKRLQRRSMEIFLFSWWNPFCEYRFMICYEQIFRLYDLLRRAECRTCQMTREIRAVSCFRRLRVIGSRDTTPQWKVTLELFVLRQSFQALRDKQLNVKG